jgi:hypothetical protein
VTRAGVFVAAAAVFVIGCSSQDSSPTRGSVPSPNDGGADADSDAEAVPDPNGGRDDKTSSCYAACQNGAFTCQQKADPSVIITTVELTPEPMVGCTGTLTTGSKTPSEQSVALKLDCLAGKICKGDAPGQPATTCLPGTFSAFAFAYAPAGSALNICTRD